MNNYQNLCNNLKELKLNQISINLDEYLDKVNEGKISILDALCKFTSNKIKVKNYNAMVKVIGFPHVKELKDFYFDFQLKINKQQFLDFWIGSLNRTDLYLIWYNQGNHSYRSLADEYGVVGATIRNSGVGKIYLAISISIAAVKKRDSTYFIKCYDLINQIKNVYLEDRLEIGIKHFSKYKLFIIDETDYLPIGEQEVKRT